MDTYDDLLIGLSLRKATQQAAATRTMQVRPRMETKYVCRFCQKGGGTVAGGSTTIICCCCWPSGSWVVLTIFLSHNGCRLVATCWWSVVVQTLRNNAYDFTAGQWQNRNVSESGTLLLLLLRAPFRFHRRIARGSGAGWLDETWRGNFHFFYRRGINISTNNLEQQTWIIPFFYYRSSSSSRFPYPDWMTEKSAHSIHQNKSQRSERTDAV